MQSDSEETVPILDLSELSIEKSEEEIDTAAWNTAKDGLIDALIRVGFLQVIGHGIPRDVIDNCFENGKRFFSRTEAEKMVYYRDYKVTRCGFVPKKSDNCKVVTECFDLDKPADVKEALDVCHSCEKWIDDELETSAKKLIQGSQKLISRMMKMIGCGLTPEDPDFFARKHQKFGTKENTSQLRFLHYPPVVADDVTEIPPGLMRCGEHTDYGCLTLVFSDTCPGLQVYTRSKKYIDVHHQDGAVLVNIGDLMQMWTGDRLRSAKHRVIFRDNKSYRRTRYSLVYFSHPDEFEVVSPMPSPGLHYPDVLVKDHMDRRFFDTFERGKGLDEKLKTDE